ncbi:hypothetical protein QQM39_11935 [Streptomyces sp. DT2A-34]|uniref:hypothetical protein n=1 Tax=Streptomyces sp. DT2A-34 TaxID=3051182 RepID=UPI00265B933A|nr:hypothetical protein [Streptomyces sp. DT2A-34]MDO0911533.1 hypothetical protein [Streptomyces sp. DT2A-34]
MSTGARVRRVPFAPRGVSSGAALTAALPDRPALTALPTAAADAGGRHVLPSDSNGASDVFIDHIH